MKRGRQFKPGNKLGHGRPRGSRNKRTLTARQTLDAHSPAILDKALAMALAGDAPMLRLMVSYVLPRSTEPPYESGPLLMGTIEEISQTYDATLKRVATGKITAGQAKQIFTWMEARRQIIETQELVNRVNALEQSHALKKAEGEAARNKQLTIPHTP